MAGLPDRRPEIMIPPLPTVNRVIKIYNGDNQIHQSSHLCQKNRWRRLVNVDKVITPIKLNWITRHWANFSLAEVLTFS